MASPQKSRWTPWRAFPGANHEPRITMTATDSAPVTDAWTAQLEHLRARFQHLRPAVLAALNILVHNESISDDDAKAQASLHGVRITAASLNAARTVLSTMDTGGSPTTATSAAASTPPRTRRRPRATDAPVDAEAMIKGVVARLQAQGNAEAERLREAIRRAIATLQAAVG